MNASQEAGEEPASIVGRVSLAVEEEDDEALTCWAVTWSTRSATVWKARSQPVMVQFKLAMSPAFGLQRTFQTGMRAGDNVLTESGLGSGPLLRVARAPSAGGTPASRRRR